MKFYFVSFCLRRKVETENMEDPNILTPNSDSQNQYQLSYQKSQMCIYKINLRDFFLLETKIAENAYIVYIIYINGNTKMRFLLLYF